MSPPSHVPRSGLHGQTPPRSASSGSSSAGTLPTALIGLFLAEALERLFSSVPTAASMLLVTGALLFATDRARERTGGIESMGVTQALVIGIVQGAAIVPGISRSGATVAAGVFSGLEHGLALRYSFLLSIPAILGAFVLQLATHGLDGALAVNKPGYGLAFLAACTVGYVSIDVLLKVLLSRRLTWFALLLLGPGARPADCHRPFGIGRARTGLKPAPASLAPGRQRPGYPAVVARVRGSWPAPRRARAAGPRRRRFRWPPPSPAG